VASNSENPEGVKPLPPIRYGRAERNVDLKRGKADGRQGIPAVSAGTSHAAMPQIMSTHMETLRREFLTSAEREYACLVAECGEAAKERDTLRQRISNAEEKLPRMRKELEEFPRHPSDEELGVQDSDEVTRRRARRRYTAERNELQAKEKQLDESLGRWKVQEVEAKGRIQGWQKITRANVKQLREHAMLRASVYLSAVVDEHPHPEVVNAYFQTFLSASADWLSFTEPTDYF
jgi:hypothetical protein